MANKTLPDLIQDNFNTLKKSVNTTEVVDWLFEKDVLSLEEMATILAGETLFDKNRRLLMKMLMKGDEHLKKFHEVLNKVQPELGNLLGQLQNKQAEFTSPDTRDIQTIASTLHIQSPIILGLSSMDDRIYKLYDAVGKQELSETIQPPSGSRIPFWAQSLVHEYKLYLIGGMHSNQMIRFDFQTKEWQVLASLKNPGPHRALFVFDDCIFSVGGSNDDNTESAAVERYTIGKDRWVSLNPGPVQAAGQAGCVVDGKAYVSGGLNGNSIINDIWVISPEVQ